MNDALPNDASRSAHGGVGGLASWVAMTGRRLFSISWLAALIAALLSVTMPAARAEAETTLRIQRSAAVETENSDATFEIRGSPGAGGAAGIRTAGVETRLANGAEGGLTVTVRTDPPLPSGRIEALIRQQYVAEGFGTSGANVVEALRGQIEQAFAVNVASEFTGRVEAFVRSAHGLSIFSVDLGLSQPLRVRLGKRLFGPVFATVSQSFGGAETQVQRRYELYYRISPQLRVGYRQEDPLGRKVFFISGTASF